MKTLKKALFISFLMGMSFMAHGMDKVNKEQIALGYHSFEEEQSDDEENVIKDITPENSTFVYYTVAQKAYLDRKGYYGGLPDNASIETGVTKELALACLYSAFIHNILQGCHPGMAERDWRVRGGTQWGNQQLLRVIADIYKKDYNPNPDIQIFDPSKIDTISSPFMQFGAGYEPKSYDQMDEATQNFVTQLRKKYPGGSGEGCCIS